MDIASQYGKRWRQIYNLDKSMVVVYGKHAKVGRRWKFGNDYILEKKQSKYLGLELTRKLSWQPYKNRILAKANKNLGKLIGMGFTKMSVKGAIRVWKALLRSLFEYASAIWEGGDWEKAE